MARGIDNCNPLNIEKNSTRWQGLRPLQTDRRFFQFVSMEYGYRAAFITLSNYRKLHGLTTLRGWINRWAPSVENPDDFTEVPVKIDVYINYAYDNGDMVPVKDYPDIADSEFYDNGDPFSWGYDSVGDQGTEFDFKHEVFASNGIAKVYNYMEKLKARHNKTLSIRTRYDKFYENVEENIYRID